MGVLARLAPALSAVSMADNSVHRTQLFGRKVMGLRGLRGERGQSMVEYALVLPILLLLLLGIMEFGIGVFNYNTIANAAREGARYGIVHWRDADKGEAGIRAAALALTSGLDQDPLVLVIVPTWPEGAVQVKVTYEAQLITGMIIEAVGGDPTLTLRAVATMQLE